LNKEHAWKKVSDVLAAKTKVFKLRVDSLYNKALFTLQKKNTRYENGEKAKENDIHNEFNEDEYLKEIEGLNSNYLQKLIIRTENGKKE
jgi:hypothetical protein